MTLFSVKNLFSCNNNKYIVQFIQMNRQIKILNKPNALIPKTFHRERKTQLKHTPIKDLKQKILLLLPQFAESNPQKSHRPIPYKSLTSKLRNTKQNLSRYKISFLNLKNQQISISPKRTISKLINQSELNSTPSPKVLGKSNQIKVSNLLRRNKKKSLSETSISLAYQNRLMGNTQFKYPNNAVRQFLRMTTIRQLFQSLEKPNQHRKNRLKQKKTNFPSFSRKILLPTTNNNEQKQKLQNQNTIQAFSSDMQINQNKKPRFKISIPHNLKVKPNKIVSMRIQRNSKQQFISSLLRHAQFLKNSNKCRQQQEQKLNGWQNHQKCQEAQDFIEVLKQQQFINQNKSSNKNSLKNSHKSQMAEISTEQNQLEQLRACFITKTEC